MYNISMVEGTTRYVNLTCKRKETGDDFNFENYTAQTFFKVTPRNQEDVYLPTNIIHNILSFEIPPSLTIGKSNGIIETRIFKNDEVVSVIIAIVSILKSPKPDIVPFATGEES